MATQVPAESPVAEALTYVVAPLLIVVLVIALIVVKRAGRGKGKKGKK